MTYRIWDVTSSTDANTADIVLQYRHEKNSERFERLSNEAADCAMGWGLEGYAVVAEYAAVAADAYAEAASAWRNIEMLVEKAA